MKELTKAEEQIMQVLWDLNRAFVKEIIDRLPDPKPAYNTVSTIVRILQDKGFVGHETYGKSHCYYPLVDKNTYTRKFLKEENVDLKELEKILEQAKKTQENKGE